MAGGTDNFRAPATVSAAASINVPGTPLVHRADGLNALQLSDIHQF
jgi:hypothetical protein